MPRLMSVSYTEDAVVERRKTVTRRLGWRDLKAGDPLTLCRKVMGRVRRVDGTIEPLVRLAEVQVVSVRREPLAAITEADVAREGFPGWSAEAFVDFFTREFGVRRDDTVTRVEWVYIEGSTT